jgi:hypothetical protein
VVESDRGDPVWTELLDGALHPDWALVDRELRQFLSGLGRLADHADGYEAGPIWPLGIGATMALLLAQCKDVMRHNSIEPNSWTAGGEWAPFSGEGPLTRNGHAGALAHLVEAFAAAWERGERPAAEAFLDRHPRLTLEPEAAIRLIYEEVCIRKGEGQEVRLS